MFNKVVDEFSLAPTDVNMDELIRHAKSERITDDDILYLAKALAYSGEYLVPRHNQVYADIPSTGGPSSLSTLICPLVLKEAGFTVPKLSVPGRPAGGVDVLAQIKNYKIEFLKDEIETCLRENKYCHFLVGDSYAPLDKLLFNFRASVGAKAVPSLVIASILSKKIAMGLSVAGLDVRIFKDGNFGKTWDEAKLYSRRFIRVARLANIDATCFLNDFSVLQQPFIGRGEALVAMWELFQGTSNNLLADHYFRCLDMGCELARKGRKYPTLDTLKRNFTNNLIAQGSCFEDFQSKVTAVQEGHSNKILATRNGFFRTNLGAVRDAIVWQQTKDTGVDDPFPDPCGLIFKQVPNSYVRKGDVLLTYRIETRHRQEFENQIRSSIEISARYPQSLTYNILK